MTKTLTVLHGSALTLAWRLHLVRPAARSVDPSCWDSVFLVSPRGRGADHAARRRTPRAARDTNAAGTKLGVWSSDAGARVGTGGTVPPRAWGEGGAVAMHASPSSAPIVPMARSIEEGGRASTMPSYGTVDVDVGLADGLGAPGRRARPRDRRRRRRCRKTASSTRGRPPRCSAPSARWARTRATRASLPRPPLPTRAAEPSHPFRPARPRLNSRRPVLFQPRSCRAQLEACGVARRGLPRAPAARREIQSPNKRGRQTARPVERDVTSTRA